jgi:hypothetical protein
MSSRTQPTLHRVIHWIFQRGHEQLACGVHQDAGRTSYTVSLVPDGNADLTLVERFESGIAALQRHAALAAQLRELGWTLVAHTDRRTTDAPSYEAAVA